ncbi:hypothetical protein, partial [Acinetobacter baumannii]|uniref:hypothetical protein n=1 Tax=Acinetobacter baumannii TaxID=470 RepID=UPI0004F542AE
MVAERKGVDRLALRTQHAQGVPLPSYRNKKEGRVHTSKKHGFFDDLRSSLSKPAGNVGQQRHHNL